MTQLLPLKARMKGTRKRLLIIPGCVVGVALLGVVLVWMWNRICGNDSIVFYGKVVDERGVGIPDLEVDFQILYSDKIALPVMYGREERIRHVAVNSDADGDFELTGASGYAFSLTFRKDGRALPWAPGAERWWQHPSPGFQYDERTSRAQIPNAPSRRLIYPLSLSKSHVMLTTTRATPAGAKSPSTKSSPWDAIFQPGR
jgi:hypothetical protein